MGVRWGDGGGRGGEGGARVCPTETLLTLCAVVLTEDAVPVERCGGVGGAGGEGEGGVGVAMGTLLTLCAVVLTEDAALVERAGAKDAAVEVTHTGSTVAQACGKLGTHRHCNTNSLASSYKVSCPLPFIFLLFSNYSVCPKIKTLLVRYILLSVL